DHINSTRADHIVTIEDPIEFLHQHKLGTVHQRELHSDTGSFASALRAALRQAPKVILVGEMRDQETIEIAMTAAETGHLVFSTLHTIDASQRLKFLSPPCVRAIMSRKAREKGRPYWMPCVTGIRTECSTSTANWRRCCAQASSLTKMPCTTPPTP